MDTLRRVSKRLGDLSKLIRRWKSRARQLKEKPSLRRQHTDSPTLISYFIPNTFDGNNDSAQVLLYYCKNNTFVYNKK